MHCSTAKRSTHRRQGCKGEHADQLPINNEVIDFGDEYGASRASPARGTSWRFRRAVLGRDLRLPTGPAGGRWPDRRPSRGARNKRRGRGSAWPCRRAPAGRPGRRARSAASGADNDQRPACRPPRPERRRTRDAVQPPGRPSSGSIISFGRRAPGRPAQAAAGRDRRRGAATSGPCGGISIRPSLAILNSSSVSRSPGP